MEKLFNDLDLADRLKQIKEEAVDTEVMEYMRPLDDAEHAQLKNEQYSLAMKLFKLDKKKKALLEKHNAEAKPVKNKLKQVMESMETKSMNVEGDIYFVVDAFDQQMMLVDEEGNIIERRPLTAQEKQITLQPAQDLAMAVND